MTNSELRKYIELAKSKGATNDEIKSQLSKSGWSEYQIKDALSSKDTTINDLPPPPVPHLGMWVTFEYVILFICLYISAVSFGGILHNAVDKIIPDALDYTNQGLISNDWLLKGYIAGIIVSFPIFALLFFILRRELLTSPAVRNLKARKILIYLTMVITFIIMISHLIATIYSYLQGATTLRSGGHLIVTFLVAGSIFLYLFREVQDDRKTA